MYRLHIHFIHIVFKNLSSELAPVLTKLFKKCVSIGEFPSCWKLASVVPVPKKGSDSSLPSSYRPISLLPVAGKIFEALINQPLQMFCQSSVLAGSHRETWSFDVTISNQLILVLSGHSTAGVPVRGSCFWPLYPKVTGSKLPFVMCICDALYVEIFFFPFIEIA